MTSVLHLVDPMGAGPFAAHSIRTLLDNQAGRTRAEVIVLGGADAAERARECGLEEFVRISPPFGRPWLGWGALRRAIRHRPPVDLVVSWSACCAALAAFALPRTPALAVVGEPPEPSGAGLIARRLLSRLGPAGVRFASARTRREWTDADARLAGAAMLPPPPLTGMEAGRRRRWRAAWGASDDPVIAFVADDESRADAHEAAFVTGLLGLAGRKSTGVISVRAHSIERAWRIMEKYGHRWPLTLEALPACAWIGACDVVCAMDGEDAMLAEAASALGLPVVPQRDPRGLAGDLLRAIEGAESGRPRARDSRGVAEWRAMAESAFVERLRPGATAASPEPSRAAALSA